MFKEDDDISINTVENLEAPFLPEELLLNSMLLFDHEEYIQDVNETENIIDEQHKKACADTVGPINNLPEHTFSIDEEKVETYYQKLKKEMSKYLENRNIDSKKANSRIKENKCAANGKLYNVKFSDLFKEDVNTGVLSINCSKPLLKERTLSKKRPLSKEIYVLKKIKKRESDFETQIDNTLMKNENSSYKILKKKNIIKKKQFKTNLFSDKVRYKKPPDLMADRQKKPSLLNISKKGGFQNSTQISKTKNTALCKINTTKKNESLNIGFDINFKAPLKKDNTFDDRPRLRNDSKEFSHLSLSFYNKEIKHENQKSSFDRYEFNRSKQLETKSNKPEKNISFILSMDNKKKSSGKTSNLSHGMK